MDDVEDEDDFDDVDDCFELEFLGLLLGRGIALLLLLLLLQLLLRSSSLSEKIVSFTILERSSSKMIGTFVPFASMSPLGLRASSAGWRGVGRGAVSSGGS